LAIWTEINGGDEIRSRSGSVGATCDVLFDRQAL